MTAATTPCVASERSTYPTLPLAAHSFFLGAEAGYYSGDAFTLDIRGGLAIPLVGDQGSSGPRVMRHPLSPSVSIFFKTLSPPPKTFRIIPGRSTGQKEGEVAMDWNAAIRNTARR